MKLARAGPIFDDERLAKPLRQPFTDQACHDVGRARTPANPTIRVIAVSRANVPPGRFAYERLPASHRV
jgi:hypothetical protein